MSSPCSSTPTVPCCSWDHRLSHGTPQQMLTNAIERSSPTETSAWLSQGATPSDSDVKQAIKFDSEAQRDVPGSRLALEAAHVRAKVEAAYKQKS